VVSSPQISRPEICMHFSYLLCMLHTQRVSRALSPGVKRTGREADHSLLFSAEVKNAWSYTSIPPYVFIKQRDKFTFTFILLGPIGSRRLQLVTLGDAFQESVGFWPASLKPGTMKHATFTFPVFRGMMDTTQRTARVG
jgi:hypothetical protein